MNPTITNPVALDTTAVETVSTPEPANYLVVVLKRPYTDCESAALHEFIRKLPVSREPCRADLIFLHRFVAPMHQCQQPETVVSANEITALCQPFFASLNHTWTSQHTENALNHIFKTTNLIVFGQLEVERDSTNNSLKLRLNRDNHVRLVDFMISTMEDLV